MMRVAMMPILEIIPYARNPRIPGMAVSKVKVSLKEFGWRQPIVVDQDRVIVVGHTRYLAALELGWTEAPVHVAENLTPSQCKAYRIADNRTAQEATWDTELLSLEMEDLQALEFDLELTGFDAEELAGMAITLPDEQEAPADFKEVDENIETEHTCPRCGYSFSGGH
jgi:ParB-like chromosome segregation protein Spo0J